MPISAALYSSTFPTLVRPVKQYENKRMKKPRRDLIDNARLQGIAAALRVRSGSA
jgi:hypothetical protein